MRALLVATGGGGDALASLLLADALGVEPVATATLAWERKMFDPRPGPRGAADFAGLRRVGSHNWRVPATAELQGGTSFLPGIAAASDVPLYLLDPAAGASGIRSQLGELVVDTGAEATLLVDVGGDVLATGSEAGLRSPLADALVLAAASGLEPSYVFCLGLGLDGELSDGECRSVASQARREGWGRSAPLGRGAADRFRDEFSWHPSEATRLTCLAAAGFRGCVEMRSEGLTVQLRDDSAMVHRFDYAPVLARNRVAQAVMTSDSFAQAESRAREVCGTTEMDLERAAVARTRDDAPLEPDATDFEALERLLLEYSDAAARRGIRYLTARRVAEVVGVRGQAFSELGRHLQKDTWAAWAKMPLWPCRASDRPPLAGDGQVRRFE